MIRDPSVGFIGLGNMGGAIAERLLVSGCVLHICDRDARAVTRLATLGGVPHVSAKSIADAADIVFTCLPNIAASGDVVYGASGLSEGGRLRCLVEMGTVGPALVREFADHFSPRGIALVDAPVSGGAPAARAGSLTIMVAAAADGRRLVDPLLALISSSIIVIGESPGDAQTMKLINNLLAAANMAVSFEALVLGVKLGLRPSKMTEVISRSSGANTGFTARRIDAIRSRRFDNGGKIALLDKDVALAFEQATQAGFPIGSMPALTGMAKLWEKAVAQGLANEDVTALVKVVEGMAGLEVLESDS